MQFPNKVILYWINSRTTWSDSCTYFWLLVEDIPACSRGLMYLLHAQSRSVVEIRSTKWMAPVFFFFFHSVTVMHETSRIIFNRLFERGMSSNCSLFRWRRFPWYYTRRFRLEARNHTGKYITENITSFPGLYSQEKSNISIKTHLSQRYIWRVDVWDLWCYW